MGEGFELSEPIPWVDIDKTTDQDVVAAVVAPKWRYLLSTIFWREESVYTEYVVDEQEPAWYPPHIMEELYGREWLDSRSAHE